MGYISRAGLLLMGSALACAPLAHQVTPALGGRCGAMQSLSDAEVSARLRFIEDALVRARGPTRAWFSTWITLLGAASAAQVTLVFAAPTRDLKIDAGVGAVGTAVALIPLIAAPRRALSGSDVLEADAMRSLDARARLCQAEGLLESAARDASAGASWIAHASGDAAALVLAAVQAFVFHHRLPGAFTAVAGTVGNELLVFSQPTRVVEAWDLYAHSFDRNLAAPEVRWEPLLTPQHVGFRLIF